MKANSLAMVAIATLFLAACAPQPAVNITQNVSVIGNQAAMIEIARLGSLTEKGNVTVDDFKYIQALLKDDDYATDELGEITTMVKYGEFVHAGHGIGFIADYLQTGNILLCPGHELSHYYVFNRHNETERAQDALQTAEQELPKWMPKAEAYSNAYPGPVSYNDTLAAIQSHIAAINAGNTTASDQEIDFLSNALCVQDT